MRRFKLKTFMALVAVPSFLSMISIGFVPAVFAAGGPYTCTWTGNGNDTKFSTAGNWSGCNSSSPQAGDGDNLVFNTTSLLANATPNNDITSLTVGSISFTGSGTHTFTLTGNTLLMSGDISDSSNQNNTISNNLTFSGTTTINTASGIGLAFNGAISGSGSLNKTGAGGANMLGPFTLSGAVNASAGSMSISAGSTDASFSSLALGTNVDFYFDVFSQSGAGNSFTMTKPITTNGGTFYINSATALSSMHDVNLTGAYSLNANAYLNAASNVTVHVQGPLSGTGFVLGASGAGTVSIESSNNTSATPSGTQANTGGGAGAAPAVTPTDTAPATPDTGLARVSAHPMTVLIVSTIAASALFLTARRLKPATSHSK